MAMTVSSNGALTEKTEKLQVKVWGQINNRSSHNYARVWAHRTLISKFWRMRVGFLTKFWNVYSDKGGQDNWAGCFSQYLAKPRSNECY